MTEHADDVEAIRLARVVEPIYKSEGWDALKKIADEQIRVRQDILLKPSHELSKEVTQLEAEYIKGVVYGLGLFFLTVQGIVETKDAIISQQGDELDEDA